MLLYIIRHGDPDYETDSLTPKGKREAEAVARRMCQVRPDKIYSSPMGRGKETAQPTCELLKKEAEILDWAEEIDQDRITCFPDGKPKSVTYLPNFYYRTDKNLNLNYEEGFNADGFADTNMKHAYEIITTGCDELLARHGYKRENGIYKIEKPNDDKIVLFCHSCMGRAMLSHLLHIPPHIMWSSFAYSYTGVTIINFPNHKEGYTAPQCLSYCDLGHLFADRQSMIFDNRIEI